MSLRARLTIAAAAAVALAVVLASISVFVLVRGQLRGQLDDALRERAARPHIAKGFGLPFELNVPRFGGAAGYVQYVSAAGQVARPEGFDVPLPTEGAQKVAAGLRDEYFEDATVQGTRVRMLTTPVEPGIAAQIVRPLDEVDRTLDRLALLLVGVSLAGIALAAGAGLLVARAALLPVRRLTEAAEHVTETRDLTRRIEAGGDDELARLARSFNEMLAALEQSIGAQRQLVADASHELRTPLTSIRTNVDVLARGDVSDEVREKIMGEVRGELEELTELVRDLVDLARGREQRGAPEEIRLDFVVAEAVERARRYAPQVDIVTALEPTTVIAVGDRVGRAVANLLDNAVKWSPAGGRIEVLVRDGEVVVRDNGPGIPDEDLPHVFDRFYRAPAARGVPGSGLGLAIVRQVADEHGGAVTAAAAEGGGAELRMRLAPRP